MDRRKLIWILLFPLLAAGCLGHSGGQHATTATTVTPTTTATAAVKKMHLTVYAMRAGQLTAIDVQVPQTEATAAAALHALGIDAGVTIAGGTATVDFPDATQQQIAEIVYTLTQFPSVQRVDIAAGKGLTRTDVDATYLPQIFVESPGMSASVPKTFHVTGTAQVFEATFLVELRIANKVVVKQTVTASEGAPNRGTFDVTLTSPSTGPVDLVAYEPSAENGTPLHTVHVPITVVP
ncbi:MAG TPA: Gmad2 immunoglobulin-like domain-containing protein [Gaiellaceae bacterium]|nr:Gmad2 immunoglobulin-like domain-containing protein [Gaiellaceae bacterium]